MKLFKTRVGKENETMLSGLIAMMFADGDADPQELAVLRGIARRLGFSDARVGELFSNPKMTTMPKDPAKRAMFLLFMFEMMWADGIVTPEEADLALSCGMACGYSAEQVAVAGAAFKQYVIDTQGNCDINFVADAIAENF